MGKKHDWKIFYKENEDSYTGKNLKIFGNYLIIGNNNRITILELEEDKYSKKGTIEKGDISNSNLKDFILFDKRIIILTDDNNVAVLTQRGKILQKMSLGNGAKGESLTICNKNRYLVISERDDQWNSSAIRVFEIINGRITLLTMLDMKGMEIKELYSLSFSAYFRNSIILSAIPLSNNPTQLLTFKYDIKENKLEEVKDLRKDLEMGNIWKLGKKNNGDIFGISDDDKLLELNYNG